MKRKICKITVLILVFSFFLSVKHTAASVLMGTAFAVLGGIIAMTIFTGGAATLVNYQQGVYARNGWGSGQAAGDSVVTPSGQLGRAATVQWIDTKNIDPATKAPTVKQRDVSLKADLQKMMDAVKNAADIYPKLAALAASRMPPNYDVNFREKVGDKINLGGTTYTISNITTSHGYASCFTPGYPPSIHIETNPGGKFLLGWKAGGGLNCGSGYTSYQYSELYLGPNTTPTPPVPPTPSEYASSLTKPQGSVSGTLLAPEGVFSDYYGEIDDYLKNHPGNVSVVDSVSPSSVDSGISVVLPTPATQTGVNAAASRQAASDAAAAASSSANNAVNTAQNNFNNSPTPENAQKLADATAYRDSLVAEQSQRAADEAEEAAEEELSSDSDGDGIEDDDGVAQDTGGFDSPAYGGKTDDELSLGNRFKTFFDQMKTTAIFSLPNQFLSGLPSGGSSIISFDGGRFGVHTFDFSTFSSVWLTLRAVILVMFGWFAIRIVSLKGGGG